MLRPIPFRMELSSYLKYTGIFVGFLFVFLSFYQPFFMADLSTPKLWSMVAMICLFTASTLLLNYYVIAYHLPQLAGNWNATKELFWILLNFILIGSFNYLIATQMVPYPLPFFKVLIYTASVGILPVVADLIIRARAEQAAMKKAELLFVKSDGNYLHVYHRNGSETKREIVRSPLHKFKNEHTELIQIHKSYLVNTKVVQRHKGNSNGAAVLAQ